MPALVIPGAAQIKLYWDLGGALGVNVLGARVTGSPTFAQALAESIGSAAKTAFTANLAASMAPATRLVRVGVRDVRAANLTEFRDTGAIVPGSGTGDAMPNQIAACITLTTAKSGKSFRGRCYLSGWTEAVNSAGGVASPAVGGGAVSFLQAIDSTLQANGMKLGVLSYPSEDVVVQEITTHANSTTTIRTISHQTAKTGGVEPVITVSSRNVTWETQRRRNNGRAAPPSLLSLPVASVNI